MRLSPLEVVFDSPRRLGDVEFHDVHEPWVVYRYVKSIKNISQGFGREVHVGDDVFVSFRQFPIEVGVLRLVGREVVLVLLDVDCLVLDVRVQQEHAHHPYERLKFLDVLS